MSAPPRPDLAAELTKRILDAHYPEDIPIDQYRVYLWVMHVLLGGGWLDVDTTQFQQGIVLLQDSGMLEALQPWFTPDEYTADDVTVHLVNVALFSSPSS